MPTLTLQQRKDKIDCLIDKEIYDNDELVYAFVSGLYYNREIEECIGYVNTLLSVVNEEYRIYYRLWYISLLYLHGDFDMAKKDFFSLALAERESNRIARGRFIFASFGVFLLARLVSCFAKPHQNLSKMYPPSGASSFDAADFFDPKSFSRRAYRQYVQGKK